MNRTRKKQLKAIADRIRQQQQGKKMVTVYQDDEGCWWNGRPWSSGSVQFSLEEVERLRQSVEIIMVVVEEKNWSFRS